MNKNPSEGNGHSGSNGSNGKPKGPNGNGNGNGKAHGIEGFFNAPADPATSSAGKVSGKKEKPPKEKPKTKKRIIKKKPVKPEDLLKHLRPIHIFDPAGYEKIARKYQALVEELGEESIVLQAEFTKFGAENPENWYRHIARTLPASIAWLKQLTMESMVGSMYPKVELKYDENNHLKETKVTQQFLNPSYVSIVKDLMEMEFEVAKELRPKQQAPGALKALPPGGDPVKHALVGLIADRVEELKERFRVLAEEREKALAEGDSP